jgi:cytochrome oxidase assembly protein ShyY1
MSKSIRFSFSPRISLICILLATLFLRLSYWQWTRHVQKREIIAGLSQRLLSPIIPLDAVIADGEQNPSSVAFRRVQVKGTYDFSHEVVLRNRRHETLAGVMVITPLLLDGSNKTLLVNRGFIPLVHADHDTRTQFQTPRELVSLTLLLKETVSRRLFAPKDAVNSPTQRLDAWLRVDIDAIQRQIPYPILPFYGEVIPEKDVHNAETLLIRPDSSERTELLSLASRKVTEVPDLKRYTFPIPTLDTIVPPARHLGYVFEWGLMAFATILIGGVLQLKRN